MFRFLVYIHLLASFHPFMCRFEGFVRRHIVCSFSLVGWLVCFLSSQPFVYTRIFTVFLFLSGGATVGGGALACAADDCV